MRWNGASCCELVGKSMETETTTSEFPNGGKAIVEKILASEEINKSKRAEFVIKMLHTSMEMDEPPAINVKYGNITLLSTLPSDQVADQILEWVHNIRGYRVIVKYDNVRHPGEFTNIKGDDIQVNAGTIQAVLLMSVFEQRLSFRML